MSTTVSLKHLLLIAAVLVSGCGDIEKSLSKVENYIPADSQVLEIQYDSVGSISWVHFKWNGRCYIRRAGTNIMPEANCTESKPEDTTNDN